MKKQQKINPAFVKMLLKSEKEAKHSKGMDVFKALAQLKLNA